MAETLAGFGMMVEADEDAARLTKNFTEMTIAWLSEMRRDPDKAEARREQQIAYVRETYSWAKRALEWESYLSDIVRQHG